MSPTTVAIGKARNNRPQFPGRLDRRFEPSATALLRDGSGEHPTVSRKCCLHAIAKMRIQIQLEDPSQTAIKQA